MWNWNARIELNSHSRRNNEKSYADFNNFHNEIKSIGQIIICSVSYHLVFSEINLHACVFVQYVWVDIESGLIFVNGHPN